MRRRRQPQKPDGMSQEHWDLCVTVFQCPKCTDMGDGVYFICNTHKALLETPAGQEFGESIADL